jgi:hypothetical protein
MRTWRYWSLEDKPWINELKNMLLEASGEMLGARRPQPQPQQQVQPQQKEPRRIFSIKTSSGSFEHDGSVYYSLFRALRERFPKMSDDTIKKIMNNPNNYRMEESRKTVKLIIREVIDELMNNEIKGADNDTVEITPDMNLGKFSPLEVE